MTEYQESSLQEGVQIIKDYVKLLPNTPGVYRMLSETDDVLYVGKAKSLSDRVTSYTRPKDLPRRIQRMIALTRKMVFVHTRSEAEALLLESSLIKSLSPKFNVLLKDDKNLPEILITKNHDFPLVTSHRGVRQVKGDYFGPFASTWAVNETITMLQKVFLLRSCSDNVFNNRSRPCLLYQIKRCSAPCVGEISKDEYIELIKQAKQFLQGNTKEIRATLTQKMQEASNNMQFEEAAIWRDRLRAITGIQTKQSVNLAGNNDLDIIALHRDQAYSCIQVFFFRAGRNQGNQSYFPKHDIEDSDETIMSAFLGQFYARFLPPPEIYVSTSPDDPSLKEALYQRRESKVTIAIPKKGEKLDVLKQALLNAKHALERKLHERSTWQSQLRQMSELLELDEIPTRIEIYDNSHIQGNYQIGAMVVASPHGFEKSQYRKFNIKDETIIGDDFAMMKEVMQRRFTRLQKGEGTSPDLVLIDGGKGQLSSVVEIIEDLGVRGVTFVAVSKGKDRNAGKEQLHFTDGKSFFPEENTPALWFLQKLRDEAHRFAISTHRSIRAKSMKKSKLDSIKGIGPKKKKALLSHFGSVKEMQAASVDDLCKVEGISIELAQTILDALN